MPFGRKRKLPPFEVMGSAGRRVGKPDAEAADAAAPEVDAVGEGESPEGVVPPTPASMTPPQVPRSQGPIVLRVPPGFAVVLAVLGVGVVVLAYWVGYSEGKRSQVAEQARQRRMLEQMEERAMLEMTRPSGTPLRAASSGPKPQAPSPGRAAGASGAPGAPGVPGVPGVPGAPGVTPAIVMAGGEDPRQKGLNYFVLIHYPVEARGEAEALVGFLRARGVDAAAILRHNGRLFQVVALRGFAPEELHSADRREYERRLRQLGRDWQVERKGAGNLSDMYPSKFE